MPVDPYTTTARIRIMFELRLPLAQTLCGRAVHLAWRRAQKLPPSAALKVQIISTLTLVAADLSKRNQ